MRKGFMRKLCMVLAVCMLFTALPVLSLAQEAAVPAQAAETAAPTVESTKVETVPVDTVAAEETESTDVEELAPEKPDTEAPAPEETEPTDGEPAPEEAEPTEGEAPAPEEAEPADGEVPETEESAPAEGEAASIVSFALEEEGIAVPRGTAETDLGLPAELTATFSDGTSAPVAVTWVCVDDGNGGTAYKPENSTESVFTFRAVLVEDIPCDAELPTMGVAILDAPMPLTVEEDMAKYGLTKEGDPPIPGTDYEIFWGDGSINLYKGTYYAKKTENKVTIVACSNATLIADEELNADVTVNGGTATLCGLTGELGVKAGTATVTSGSVASLWIQEGQVELKSGVTVTGKVEMLYGGSLTANSATIGGEVWMNSDSSLTANSATINGNVTMYSGSSLTVNSSTVGGGVWMHFVSSLTATSTNFNNTISFDGGTCEITGGSIAELYIYNLPTDGKVEVTCDNITKLSISPDILTEDILKPIVEDNWPADTVLKPGEKTTDIEVSIDEVKIGENLCIRCVGLLNVEYMPVESVVPGEGETIKYLTWAELKGGYVCSNVPDITRTVPTTLYLKSGTISKTYDGNGDFESFTVTDAVWQKSDGTEYDVDTSACTVTVTATADNKDAGTYTVDPTSVQVTGTVPENIVLSTDMTKAQITATIAKKEVTITGTIYRNGPEDQLTWAQAAQQPTVYIRGLVNNETVEVLGTLTLSGMVGGHHILGNALTEDITNDYTGVYEIVPAPKNYDIKRKTGGDYGLYVSYRFLKSDPVITSMADWYTGPGALPFPTPVLNHLGLEERSVEYQYRPAGSTDETAWTTTQPKALGDYQVRAVLGAYNEYLPETTEPVDFSIRELTWSVNLSLSKNEAEFGDVITATATVVGEGSNDFKICGSMVLYSGDAQLVELVHVDAEDTYKATFDRVPGTHPLKAVYTPNNGTPISSNNVELHVSKRDVLRDASSTISGGTYSGLETPSGACIELSFPEYWEVEPEDLELSFTRQLDLFDAPEAESYAPRAGELVKNDASIRFTPHQAGKYTMTVKVSKDNLNYTGAKDFVVEVDRTWISITLKESTVEQGQPFTPEYEISSEYPLAEGDAIVHIACYYDGNERLTDTSRLEVGRHKYNRKTIRIEAEDGTDVTDSYRQSIVSSSAYVTVMAPKMEIAVSFAETGIEAEKTLSAWTPGLTAAQVQAEAFAFVRKLDDASYAPVQFVDGVDAFDLTLKDEDGNVLGVDDPLNAGTYKLVFKLKGAIADTYALRLADSSSPDTLTLTIPRLDLEDAKVTVDIADGIYNYEASDQNVPPASLSVKVGEHALVAGTDYEVVYPEGGNTQPGKAYLKIVGIGNCMGERDVDYNVVAPAKFTITIPATVLLSDDAGSMSISCTLQGSDDPQISVSVDSANGFQLCERDDASKSADYELLSDGEKVAGGEEVARFAKLEGEGPLVESKSEQELIFAVNGPVIRGSYSDQLTFTASVVK